MQTRQKETLQCVCEMEGLQRGKQNVHKSGPLKKDGGSSESNQDSRLVV